MDITFAFSFIIIIIINDRHVATSFRYSAEIIVYYRLWLYFISGTLRNICLLFLQRMGHCI